MDGPPLASLDFCGSSNVRALSFRNSRVPRIQDRPHGVGLDADRGALGGVLGVLLMLPRRRALIVKEDGTRTSPKRTLYAGGWRRLARA